MIMANRCPLQVAVLILVTFIATAHIKVAGWENKRFSQRVTLFVFLLSETDFWLIKFPWSMLIYSGVS